MTHQTPRTGLLALTLAGALATACVGEVGGPDGERPSPPGRSDTPASGRGDPPASATAGTAAPPPTAPVGTDAVGPHPLLRLTNDEYDATVRDLLGDGSAPSRAFPPDVAASSGFAGAAPPDVTQARALQQAAEALAAAAMPRLPMIFPCTGADEACAARFVTDFGKRAFRRPLTTAEADDLRKLYAAARADLGYAHADALRVVLQTMLQMPQFLYRWELGAQARADGKVIRLGPYETASRLSYLLWGTMPDGELMAAADAGKLASADDVERQARRLLGDARARDRIAAFHARLLGTHDVAAAAKNATVYPSFSPALGAAMAKESAALTAAVVLDGDGKLGTLFSSARAFVDETMAKLYGVTGVRGTEAVDRTLDGAQRAGLLTRAAFLTAQGASNGSHPVKRGKVVLTRLMCAELQPPGMEIPKVKDPSPNLTTRQRFAEHATAACKGCHDLLDPLGFAFEHYDGIGQFRAREGALPVDASGTVTLGGAPRRFADARELSALLAAADEVRDCYVRQLFRFAMGRHEEADDAATLAATRERFARSDASVRELLVGMTTSRAFLFRAAAPGEVTR